MFLIPQVFIMSTSSLVFSGGHGGDPDGNSRPSRGGSLTVSDGGLVVVVLI